MKQGRPSHRSLHGAWRPAAALTHCRRGRQGQPAAMLSLQRPLLLGQAPAWSCGHARPGLARRRRPLAERRDSSESEQIASKCPPQLLDHFYLCPWTSPAQGCMQRRGRWSNKFDTNPRTKASIVNHFSSHFSSLRKGVGLVEKGRETTYGGSRWANWHLTFCIWLSVATLLCKCDHNYEKKWRSCERKQ